MQDSLKLGRLGGVRVGANWSIFVLVALVAYALATSSLPAGAPGYSRLAYWVAGVAAALALLVGVLLHEVAHAIAARRAHMRVDGITLWFMGGFTRIEGEEYPRSELWIALVGPLTSIVLGGAVLGVALGARSAGWPLVASTLGWLGGINILLGLFNLLPASPLDGGKVLHGALWWATGKRYLATRLTTGTGTVLGALGIAGGFITMEMGDFVDGIVFALLGWFVLSSARGEQMAGRARYVLGDVRISDIMRPAVIAPGWLTVSAFWSEWASQYPGAAFVLEQWAGEGWAGVLTAQQLGSVPPGLQASMRAQDIAVPLASPPAGSGKGALSAGEPALAIAGRPGLALPVEDNGKIVGVVMATDVAAMVARGIPVPRRTWGSTVWPPVTATSHIYP
ncbi:MAG: site-2 protease family protein [Actinobacteria bacterium]|nr:site-2 protease family protein [Actinomycetota bacterium]